jgi:hypothetical protein
MSAHTLAGTASTEEFRFHFVPLLPIATAVFCLSGLAFYHVELSGTGASEGLFQALLVGLYESLGFVPAFMLFLMILAWSSIWFISGSVADPAGRLGRMLLLTLSLAVLVNLQPEIGMPEAHSGIIGHFLAVRLQSIFGYTISTLLVAPLALVTLLLATDFFFYRYFETLGSQDAGAVGSARETGVETEVTETLKSLRFFDEPREKPRSVPSVSPVPEASGSVRMVASLDCKPRTVSSAKQRLILDVDEEIAWEPGGEELAVGVATAGNEARDKGSSAVADAVADEGDEPARELQVPDTDEGEGAEEGEAEPDEGDWEAEESEDDVEEEDDEAGDYEEEGDYEADPEDEDAEPDFAEDEDSAEDDPEEEDTEEEDSEEEDFDLSLDVPDEVPVLARGLAPTRLGEIGVEEQVVMFLEADEEVVGSPVDEPVVEIPHPIQVSGMLQEATELILKSGRVSATFLQRRLRVDFQQAMGLLSELKGQGLINIGEGETHGKLA